MKHRDDLSLWVQYKQARNNFCKAIRLAKKLAWKSFTEDASNMNGMLKVSRAILQKRQTQVGHLKKRDGTYTQNRGRCWTPFLMSSFQIQLSSKGPKHLLCIMSSRMTFLTFFPLGNLKSPSNPLKKGKLLDRMGLALRSFKT